MEAIRGWEDLGVVDTIYEEEDEDSSTTPSLSPPLSSPPTPLHCTVEAWSVATGRETDVVVYVQSACFHLHKDPLTSRSSYLKRQLKQMSEITLSPQLKITAETFDLVANFCYGSHIVITPFNVAALRTAAELLEMTETNGAACQDNLRQKMEVYFRRAVTVSREYALIVFRSCLSLLPEAETTAFLVSRCIEALSLMIDDEDGVMRCIDDVKTVGTEDFQLVADSMSRQMSESHDLLYRIIDLYLMERNGKITEEQKIRICNNIDCNIISPQLLMHAVQNPRMPLRFVVQAMFVEQLNTRRSIFSSSDRHHICKQKSKDAATLGALLERDAALRQVAQLKSAMEATSSRLQTLETQLSGMKKVLNESENVRTRSELDSGRSLSFRFSSENKVEREERGSVSFHIVARKERAGGSSSSQGLGDGSARVEKSFGRRLMNGLKSVFGASVSGSKKNLESKVVGDGDENGNNGDVIVIKKDIPFSRRV